MTLYWALGQQAPTAAVEEAALMLPASQTLPSLVSETAPPVEPAVLRLPPAPVTQMSNLPLAPASSSRLAPEGDALRLEAARAGTGDLPGSPGAAASATPTGTASVTATGTATTTPTPTSTATATATPDPAYPACDESHSPLFCVYTVEDGDTLSKIATKFGLKSSGDIASWDLLVQSNRPDIVNADDFIQPGQKLRIPTDTGIIHLVLGGESPADLASSYGVAIGDITTADGLLTELSSLEPGEEVLIKNPQQMPKPKQADSLPVAEPTAALPTVTPTPTPTAASLPETQPTPQPTVQAPVAPLAQATATPILQPLITVIPQPPQPLAPTPTRQRTGVAIPGLNGGFAWPTTGPISSYFGPAHPLGIDIDLFSNDNAPINASAAGTVTFAGGNTCCSYGLYVIIDHGNGFKTLYAHMSRILVSTGQRVVQGQLLGIGGRTGYATGNHLHFEVHYKDAVVDPLLVLPR